MTSTGCKDLDKVVFSLSQSGAGVIDTYEFRYGGNPANGARTPNCDVGEIYLGTGDPGEPCANPMNDIAGNDWFHYYHTLTPGGAYTMTVTAIDVNLHPFTLTRSFTADAPAPPPPPIVASFSGPNPVYAHTFNPTYTAQASGGSGNFTFTWYKNDVYEGVGSTYNPTPNYLDPSTFELKLKVTDLEYDTIFEYCRLIPVNYTTIGYSNSDFIINDIWHGAPYVNDPSGYGYHYRVYKTVTLEIADSPDQIIYETEDPFNNIDINVGPYFNGNPNIMSARKRCSISDRLNFSESFSVIIDNILYNPGGGDGDGDGDGDPYNFDVTITEIDEDFPYSVLFRAEPAGGQALYTFHWEGSCNGDSDSWDDPNPGHSSQCWVDFLTNGIYTISVTATDANDNIGFGAYLYEQTQVPDYKISAANTSGLLPDEFGLEQNYPNPFNPLTRITYQLPEAADVTLKIYTIRGELVTTLVEENVAPGFYEAAWDASSAASGIYFVRMTAGTFTDLKKMTLIK